MLAKRPFSLRAATPSAPSAKEQLKPLRCPLDDEILVAEISGELPPGVATTVRLHVKECPVCGPRSASLVEPYNLLTRLTADQPVSVPDVRDAVRKRVASLPLGRRQRRLMATTRQLVILTVAVAVVLGTLGTVVLRYVLRPQNVPVSIELVNTVKNAPAAGESGSLLAETDVLVPVSSASGGSWMAAEVLVADERTGALTRTLPAQVSHALTADPQAQPVAVALTMDGRQLVELSAPDGFGRQALMSFDARTGELQYVTPITGAGGQSLPDDVRATSMVISPVKAEVYVGLSATDHLVNADRVVVADLGTGATLRTIAASYNNTPVLATLTSAKAGSAPVQLNTANMTLTQAMTGQIAISPDGAWLYDVVDAVTAAAGHYGILRELATHGSSPVHELAIPGNFAQGTLAASSSPYAPLLYLAEPSPHAALSVVALTTNDMMYDGTLALGGPSATSVSFTESLSLSPTIDGSHVYLAQDALAADHNTSGHDIWLVDATRLALQARRTDNLPVTGLLSNGIGGDSASSFLMRNGQIFLLSQSLAGAPQRWLALPQQRAVVSLIGVALI